MGWGGGSRLLNGGIVWGSGDSQAPDRAKVEDPESHSSVSHMDRGMGAHGLPRHVYCHWTGLGSWRDRWCSRGVEEQRYEPGSAGPVFDTKKTDTQCSISPLLYPGFPRLVSAHFLVSNAASQHRSVARRSVAARCKCKASNQQQFSTERFGPTPCQHEVATPRCPGLMADPKLHQPGDSGSRSHRRRDPRPVHQYYFPRFAHVCASRHHA